MRAGARGGAGADGSDRRSELAARVYDPRREERRAQARVPLPDDVEPQMLDQEVRLELRSLSKETAQTVARHLVVVGRTLDDEPEVALRHARAARALAGRVGSVREAVGLAAYAAGEWAEALTELRAARRITGHAGHLAVMADCERALGRPDRALALGDDPQVAGLSQPERVELVVVLSGARRDLGQAEAAVLLLQEPARRTWPDRPWAARLWYALADALLGAGRRDEAREWFARAAEADADGATDADERLLELDGVVLEDLYSEDDGEHAAGPPVDLAALLSAPGATADQRSGTPEADPAGAPVGQLPTDLVAGTSASAEALPVGEVTAPDEDEPPSRATGLPPFTDA